MGDGWLRSWTIRCVLCSWWPVRVAVPVCELVSVCVVCVSADTCLCGSVQRFVCVFGVCLSVRAPLSVCVSVCCLLYTSPSPRD